MKQQIESPQETWKKWRKWFWTKILWLAYRHLTDKGICPVGVPGVRDIDARCETFDPRPARFDPTPSCETDGHYLCEKCCHKARGLVERKTSDPEVFFNEVKKWNA